MKELIFTLFLDPPLDPGGAFISNYIVKMTLSLQQGNFIQLESHKLKLYTAFLINKY